MCAHSSTLTPFTMCRYGQSVLYWQLAACAQRWPVDHTHSKRKLRCVTHTNVLYIRHAEWPRCLLRIDCNTFQTYSPQAISIRARMAYLRSRGDSHTRAEMLCPMLVVYCTHLVNVLRGNTLKATMETTDRWMF